MRNFRHCGRTSKAISTNLIKLNQVESYMAKQFSLHQKYVERKKSAFGHATSKKGFLVDFSTLDIGGVALVFLYTNC